MNDVLPPAASFLRGLISHLCHDHSSHAFIPASTHQFFRTGSVTDPEIKDSLEEIRPGRIQRHKPPQVLPPQSQRGVRETGLQVEVPDSPVSG